MSRMLDEKNKDVLYRSSLSERDFQRLSRFIYQECGIHLPHYKRTLLESRLHKRLRRLTIPTLTEYCRYLFSPQGIKDELTHLIDVITTNKTDFFREPSHFDYLVQNVLSHVVSTKGAGYRKPLMIWSAGCSSGEEPYTLAMVMSDYSERLHSSGLDFLILATDVSTSILEKARLGIYDHEHVESVPYTLKRKYLLKGKGRTEGMVRVSPALRECVKLRRLNFLDGSFNLREPMDVIFCRNVIIYFDKPTQQQVLSRICSHLRPGGYMFMGHSETLNQLDLPLIQIAPTIYRKTL